MRGSDSDNRRLEREIAEKRRRDEAERRKASIVAERVIAIWNSRHARGAELWFYLTIRAAIAAGCPVLGFYCPGCQTTGEVDLRKIDRHRRASIESLIPALSCRRCSPHPPFAKLIGLRRARLD